MEKQTVANLDMPYPSFSANDQEVIEVGCPGKSQQQPTLCAILQVNIQREPPIDKLRTIFSGNVSETA